MKRFVMAEMISKLLIAETDIGQAAAHQQNMEVMRNSRGMHRILKFSEWRFPFWTATWLVTQRSDWCGEYEPNQL